MNYNDDIWPRVQPHGWKWERRTRPIRLILLHATRSGIAGRSPADEYGSTINWFTSPNNGVDSRGDPAPDWGGMSSVIIGGGKSCRVLPDEYYPTYSLGHGDPIGLSIELGQNIDGTPFDERDLDLAARQSAEWCRQYRIPPNMLRWLSEDNHEGPGIARHDRSDNGRHYGKSDPGRAFDNAQFEARVKSCLEEDEMDGVARQRIEDLRVFVGAVGQHSRENRAMLKALADDHFALKALVHGAVGPGAEMLADHEKRLDEIEAEMAAAEAARGEPS
jgi:hypothetical protein